MRTLCVVLLLCLPAPALAQAPAPAPTDPLVGSASLGYLSTSGNTDSTNANGSFKVTWDLDGPWKHGAAHADDVIRIGCRQELSDLDCGALDVIQA